MKKKIIVSICILLALALTVVGCSVWSSTGYQGTIKQALRIHYGWESEEHLQDITTEAFMDRLGGDSFALDRKLYFVSSIHLHSRDDLEDDEMQVTATFYNPDIMFADFILVKTDDGKYLIEDIQFDK